MLDILDDASDDEDLRGESSPATASEAILDISTENEAVGVTSGGATTGGRVENLAAIFAESGENRALSNQLASAGERIQGPEAMPELLPSEIFGGDGGKVGVRQSSWCRQTITLTQRTALVTSRDPSIIFIRTGAALIVGGLVGLIFYNQPRDESSAGELSPTLALIAQCQH